VRRAGSEDSTNFLKSLSVSEENSSGGSGLNNIGPKARNSAFVLNGELLSASEDIALRYASFTSPTAATRIRGNGQSDTRDAR